MVDERSGAGLGDLLHPISTVHGSGFVESSHDGSEQLRVDDRCAETFHEFIVEDLCEPHREIRLQGAEVER